MQMFEYAARSRGETGRPGDDIASSLLQAEVDGNDSPTWSSTSSSCC